MGTKTATIARRPAPHLTRLQLSDFRCYRQAMLEVDGRPVVLTGPNGAGKTNLLEAISLLAPGRGLRRARLAEIERDPAQGENRPAGAWAVAAQLQDATGQFCEIGTGREPRAADGNGESAVERRLVKIDGQFQRGQSALAEKLSIVWLTPQMDGLFRDGAADRRRFLDRLVYGFDPDQAARLSAYEHAMRERGRVLAEGMAGRESWLAALEQRMAAEGVAIAAARRDLIRRLGIAAGAGFGPFPGAALALQGFAEAALDQAPALAVEEALAERFAQSRPQDRESGGAAIGPHRSDLIVTHLARGRAAADCSTGEQKALLLAILLAFAHALAAERGAAPLLLLDEVAAHLDETRREALYEALQGLGAQAWLTGTDRHSFEAFGAAAQYVGVRDGRLIPLTS